MAVSDKVDSNITGLRFAVEDTLGVLPGSPTWYGLEPNSYDDFGGQISTTARAPINAGRQRQKGVVTDLDASGGFNNDLTQTNFQRLLQGFFFADFREKADTNPFNGTAVTITNVDGTGETYDAGSGLDVFTEGDLIFASGFTNSANNGLKTTAGAGAPTATAVTVNEDIVDESAPPAAARLVKVGFEFGDGLVEVDASGDLPVLDFQTGADPDSLGVIPGEWIYIGGDTSATQFSTAANNGYARVFSVTGGDAGSITLDKTQADMVTETGTTGVSLQIFTGRVIKNEAEPSNQVRRSFQLERTLGSPDDANTDLQAEYLIGSIANEFTLNFATADKITADLSFVAIDNEQRTQSEGVKSGDRPQVSSGDAYNTSNDFSRLKLSLLDRTNSNPTKLFAFVTEFSVPINNNVSPNKAISVLGAFDVTAGDFTVDGSATAYFSQVEAVQAVRNNSDVTLDFILGKNNVGIAVDVPLIALGDGRLNVEKDAPITLPLELGAAADGVFNHTLLAVFFDYLPDAAMPSA
jgi:hypothetical protein